jgi:hypothetical protein
MSKDFCCQIGLTPVIYNILREKAKSKRYSTRVYLDILLHEVLSEEVEKLMINTGVEVSLEELMLLQSENNSEEVYRF